MLLKKKAKALSHPEAALALELARSAKVDKKLMHQVLSRADTGKLKKLGLLGAGIAGAAALVNTVSQYTFYRGIVARELKKQLAPLHRQLDEMEDELQELKKQSRR